MKREEYIAIAKQIGLHGYPDEIEAFAAAIRSAVKEEDAKICSDYAKQFKDDASRNDGRQSDMAFGRICASDDIVEAIMSSK